MIHERNSMARDDFHVIVYQLLSYLYQRLKKGETVDKEMIDYDSPLYAKINKKYWAYIIYNISTPNGVLFYCLKR